MKVLHVTDHLPGLHQVWGGAEQACLQTMRLTDRYGGTTSFAVTTSLDNASAGSPMVFPLKTLVEILRFRLPFDPLVFAQMKRVISQAKPDIVHLHRFGFLSFAALSAAKRAGKPVVMSIYDYWLFCPKETLIDAKERTCALFQGLRCIPCLGSKNPFKLAFLLFRKLIFDHFLRQVDAFIVLSAASRDLLRNYGISVEKIKVVPLSYDFEEPGAKLPEEAQRLLLTGWIQPRKGQDVILRALPQILKAFPGTKLTFIGKTVDHAYQRKLEKFIKDHDLFDQVRFLGRVSDDVLKAEFEQAQVIVVPEQWQNMFPIIIVEALGKNKLVLASRIGGIPELIREGENGLLAKPDQPEEFAEKIIWAFKNQELVQRIKERARVDIMAWCDGQKNAPRLVEIYASKI